VTLASLAGVHRMVRCVRQKLCHARYTGSVAHRLISISLSRGVFAILSTSSSEVRTGSKLPLLRLPLSTNEGRPYH